MLTKRTNILFDQETWKTLVILSSQKGLSVGQLIRIAVGKTYLPEVKRVQGKQVFDQIIFLRKKSKGKINYQGLIENGRKY